jgi:general secretion pathway protein D
MKILEAVDIPPTDREMVRIFVYYVEHGEAKKLAELLKGLYADKKTTGVAPRPALPQPPRITPAATSAPVTVEGDIPGEIEGGVTIAAYDAINALVIKTTPKGYLSLLETLKKLDVPAKQVLIEVLIAEITLEEDDELGIQWGMVDGSPGHFGVNTSGVFQYPDLESDNVPSQYGSAIDGAVTVAEGYQYSILNSADFSVMLNFLNSNTQMNVRASPKILTANNKEAIVKAVREVPYVKELQQQGSGLEPIASFEYRDVGLTLTVTPHVNESELVVLSIKLEQGTVLDTPTIYNLQQFSKREINTNLGVENGNTAVLAGVISETVGDTVQKVPLLGSLPIVGRALFTNKHKSNVKTELMTFLTPYILRNADDVRSITKNQRGKLEMFKGEQIESPPDKEEPEPEPEPAPVEPVPATPEVKQTHTKSRAPQFIQGEAL